MAVANFNKVVRPSSFTIRIVHGQRNPKHQLVRSNSRPGNYSTLNRSIQRGNKISETRIWISQLGKKEIQGVWEMCIVYKSQYNQPRSQPENASNFTGLRAYLKGKRFVNIFTFFRLFFIYFTKKMARTAQLAWEKVKYFKKSFLFRLVVKIRLKKC